MNTSSCFFCQNLLSDYVEGILPSTRHEQLKNHLHDCGVCEQVHRELKATLAVLHKLPPQKLSNELALRVTEASQARGVRRISRRQMSRVALLASVPLLLILTLSLSFPGLFPWGPLLGGAPEVQFVRYYPLLQGAADILEEQSTWLHSGDTLMGSLWEEGGLSPEEFEKTFQVKPSKESSAPSAHP